MIVPLLKFIKEIILGLLKLFLSLFKPLLPIVNWLSEVRRKNKDYVKFKKGWTRSRRRQMRLNDEFH